MRDNPLVAGGQHPLSPGRLQEGKTLQEKSVKSMNKAKACNKTKRAIKQSVSKKIKQNKINNILKIDSRIWNLVRLTPYKRHRAVYGDVNELR